MYIKSVLMKKESLTTLQTKDTIEKAKRVIEEGEFLSLPVLDGDKFIGSIPIYRIYKELSEMDSKEIKGFLNSTIEDYIQEDIPKIFANSLIEDAAQLFGERNIPFVPVIDQEGRLEGIITQKTIFNGFSRLLGYKRGTRLVINIPEIKGKLSDLTNAIRRSNSNIISLVIYDPETPINVKQVIIRVETDNLVALKDKLEKRGFSIAEVSE
ncbi:CBS domain-containing protein [Clostridium sp. D2Q-11]|uniref:CBS domain-containing protein n=1 Tax=Anaeromonas frigoriresistens TaxID=2683708 RepID=A0A942URJ5_9FIRM|nr:CBS domain-containing protein [Anaeromonas frigoriresistens]MBS4537944.1 CBS domain-containing protein [Anaeromonas frigoriresistens]